MREVKKSVYNISAPTFGEIKKMPVPMDTAPNRDEEFKQKIIEYEKQILEPALTEYVQAQPAGSPPHFRIWFDADTTGMHGNTYYIGTETIQDLGQDVDFIMVVIGDVYKQEGYNVVFDEQKDTITMTK